MSMDAPTNKRGAKARGTGNGLYFAEVTIPNKKGLHARASAQFVRCAGGFDAEIRVTREGHTVGGTSIMGLMMLAAGQGHSILIEAEGGEARAAMEALIALIESGFGVSPKGHFTEAASYVADDRSVPRRAGTRRSSRLA
jgi:phosphocarrier protein HPr